MWRPCFAKRQILTRAKLPVDIFKQQQAASQPRCSRRVSVHLALQLNSAGQEGWESSPGNRLAARASQQYDGPIRLAYLHGSEAH